MGFGKFLLGAVGVVGAVVAAPIVMPAIAATAAGAAVTGAVGAAGAAVTGAVGAAGAAVASTAVGSAVVGAVGTVGTAVGTAAGAAGLSSVAAVAATEAGAAALGTIATSAAVGVASSASGAKKLSDASKIKDEANYRYNSKRQEFDSIEESTNGSLKKLGQLKVDVWKKFDKFVAIYEKIQNKPEISGDVTSESIKLTKDELKNIKGVALTVQDMLKTSAGAIGAGGLIGIATSGGLASTITVASTGTAISTLSGAAATNASLAAFGGGSLASGGLGMAGGTAVLGGLTFAPMLVVGGIMVNAKGKASLNVANDISREVDSAVSKMNEAEKLLNKVKALSEDIYTELYKLFNIYKRLIFSMEKVVSIKTNYEDFTEAEQKLLEKTILSVLLLKTLTMTDILDSKKDNNVLEYSVKKTIKEVSEQRANCLTS
ncbi:hypothetical protein ACER0A_011025 [Haloimpatiens sp. FM7315]|uniref:hypothetical protein n=1 Tax=Haloimpatiens sp. FM7315 TaxID=3298609 RepID=UPI0035A3BA2A